MNTDYIYMNPNQQRRLISREFKKRGLSLQPAALSGIQNILRREHINANNGHSSSSSSSSKRISSSSSSNRASELTMEVLQTLLDEIKKRMMNDARGNSNGNGSTNNNANRFNGVGSSGSIVTQKLLQNVVADLSRDGNDVLDEAMQLLNAWKMKRLEYNVMNKRWKLLDGSEEVNGGSSSMSNTKNGMNGACQASTGRSVFGRPSDKVRDLSSLNIIRKE